MLDIKLLREEPGKVRKAIATKNADPKLVDKFLTLDEEWRKLTKEVDERRSELKKSSARFETMSGPAETDRRDFNRDIKKKIQELGEKLADIEKERDIVWHAIPNLPSDDTPIAKDESGNKVLRTSGKPRDFSAERFKPKDHLELGEKLGLIDVESAAKVAGTRFAYLKGDAVLLEFALVQHAFEFLTNHEIMESIAQGVNHEINDKPFVPVIPPVMIRPDVFQRMGRLEPKDDRYYIPADDLYLVGSAEHTMGPLHMDQTIPEGELPIRYVGFSTAFRREAGSYGKDTRGILRVHQFDKVEIESFTMPEKAVLEQEFFVAIQENLMWELELPYRVVQICSGDMGGPDVRQIDIETWMPSQNQYRETHTSDYMGDYQARRLGTKLKRSDKRQTTPSHSATGQAKDKVEYVHMNDATVFAVGRMLIAIIENYQTKDGKIEVPKALQKYVGKKIIG
ncbi:MAG: serine--tRNA ligase [Candidatus Liptonbacteria bacterium RIFCSPLOWO2_01_FULL_52_25]|uniref:Serine--tRNA ligase n=1 Tax=Candidatus Liptonbacteria bacterium RIFCSPLOWO2_01_FULL_52_25 TaxID=1798650 RepID=A0A1G2CGR3_9BACT|nr:MAG: serine--tRNA ligase [Candidatus Liptonbacteria bacterium RIFCSPLOWO2_01_FULL_52_25]